MHSVLSKTNNFKQVYLTVIWVADRVFRVDLGVIVMKGYSTLPRSLKLDLHHVVYCHTLNILYFGG